MGQGNIVTALVQIKGVRPLLWHHFGINTLSLSKKEKRGVAGNDPDEWKESLLVADDKTLYIENAYIFACIRDGARYTKHGISTMQSSVSATLQVLDDRILSNRKLPAEISTDPTKEVYLDIRSVKNPATKGRNIRYRVASSPGWKFNFNISFDKTIVGKSEMQAIINDAGRFCGIGDGRSIGFGRFEVENFKVIGDA